jgi:hypothetical protein
LIQAAIGFCGRFGLLSDEAFRVSVEGAIEGVLAGGVDCISLTVMHLIRRHQADASVVMLLIVPVGEAAAERLGILDTAEALWELGLVFHGFEVAFRKRIVVGRMRPAVGFGDAEIGEQERRGLGSHGTATVGMQGQLAGRHGMLAMASLNSAVNSGRRATATRSPTADR